MGEVLFKLKDACRMVKIEDVQFRDYIRLLEKHGYVVQRLGNGHRVYTNKDIGEVRKMVEYAELGIPLYTTAKHIMGIEDEDTEIISILTDPNKKLFRLKGAAEKIGVDSRVFRDCVTYLEVEGHQLHRIVAGMRLYSEEDIELVRKMCRKIGEDKAVLLTGTDSDNEPNTYYLQEASIKSGILGHTFRKYMNLLEEQGYKVSKTKKGTRVYTDKDIDTAKQIKELNKSGVLLFDAVKKVLGA
ncbi:hypothetical protein ACTFR8_22840 [Bacillus cereus group sp. MYBK15-3]|uniref:hypothetical protein n=1 Tax=unclassified Bacillus cereus group TaxID=2750818 RepID=UPI003F7A2AA3